ncbi:hypothetical protein G6L16_008835 [Agrobacterium tumefaciens]|uniref:hypothetical protein n=1 Tax=Agrobacterium tumefaciens TaxID=358 RepID=UPI001574ECA7|nr:hypothetical protein [Agrobacterium tumefaciens]NSZ63443.1 hypothetical protein [Agrobacterium tumefaciens]NTA69813.1 hypothetical protein [Agrobacterium tumefaciens]WIE36959.1 hypothetical protein G6L16_008835 [Agrobacterium tumefaciens]
MSEFQRRRRRMNAVYRKGIYEGYQLALVAAEREARMCALSWDGTAAISAGVVADQIAKLEVSEDVVDQKVMQREDSET